MLKISANSLKDYQTCARLYAYRYGEDKMVEKLDPRERRYVRYDETIRRVIAFFFYKKQAMAEPSYTALLNRWQKLWFTEDTSAADLVAMKNEVLWNNDTSYTTQAANSLLQFYEEFSNRDDQQVVLIDEKFCVPLNKKIALEGSFDVVLRKKKEDGTYQYDIYKWSTGNKRPISFWTFDFQIIDYAFRYRNKFKPLDIRYHLWSFSGNLLGGRQFELEKGDFTTMEYWANQLLETEVFASRRGLTSYCKSCPFDKSCAKWLPPPVESKVR